MAELGIKEEDLSEKFVLGSGKGGQKLQKTASCVHLKHLPTGIEVKCQQERSRAVNRLLARRKLCDLVASKIYHLKTKSQIKQDKIRRQKKRRLRRLDEKRRSTKTES